MAEPEKGSNLNLAQTLTPLFQRACEAEKFLHVLSLYKTLKCSATRWSDYRDLKLQLQEKMEEYLKMIKELQLKLENANAERLAERERAEKLAVENGKLQYRIIHLLRLAKEGQQRSDQL